MASPSKKRTLSEQKSSDVEAKNSLSENDRKKNDPSSHGNENENAAMDKIDYFRTFDMYLNAKAGALNKMAEFLPQERQALNDEYDQNKNSLNMDIVLSRLHAIFLPESTQNTMDQARDDIDSLLSIESGAEEDEEEAVKALGAKVQDHIKKEITKVKNAWNTEEYQQAFDILFALTYVGCLENNGWYTEPEEVSDKSAVEELLQQIANQWTQMFSKSDKFLDSHLTLGDKHFIYAMVDAIKHCAPEYKWNFTKPKSLEPESLSWDIEQAKYNVPIIMEGDMSDEEVEDDVEDDDSDNYEDEDGQDGQEAPEEAGGEEEPTGPPSKKRKV